MPSQSSWFDRDGRVQNRACRALCLDCSPVLMPVYGTRGHKPLAVHWAAVEAEQKPSESFLSGFLTLRGLIIDRAVCRRC